MEKQDLLGLSGFPGHSTLWISSAELCAQQ